MSQWALLPPCLWTAAALLALGPSVAVGVRAERVVATGLYRLVRHPAYLGEMAIALVLASALPAPWTLWPGLLAGPVLLPRIRAEELALATLPGWSDYTRAVRWRLIPGVW